MLFFFSLMISLRAEELTCQSLPALVSEDFVAMPTTIFPGAMKRNLHFVYKNYKNAHPSCQSSEVWVQGQVFTENGAVSTGETEPGVKFEHEKLGNSFCMSRTEFQREQRLGKSVFETRVASGSKNEGTSFLIGGNIVLTNYHIAGGGANATDCRHVEVTLNDHEGEWISCKQLLYCDKEHDFCFVEMNPPPGKKSLEDLAPRVSLDCSPVKAQEAKLIGNSYTEGIQSADGRVENENVLTGTVNHKVPMVGGASGSPLFNANGAVVALNFGHSGNGPNYVSTDLSKTNYATSMNYIFARLRRERDSNAFYGNIGLQSQFDPNVRGRAKKILDVLPKLSPCR